MWDETQVLDLGNIQGIMENTYLQIHKFNKVESTKEQ